MGGTQTPRWLLAEIADEPGIALAATRQDPGAVAFLMSEISSISSRIEEHSDDLGERTMQKQMPVHRYHSLDALRGWAMLLGIVLHAAWFMSVQYYGTPITDADGNHGFVFLLAFIHMFRLQAFFLLAGFFAHLVFLRRGHWRFIWHRISRIGIPLLVGWLLLYPIMMLQYTWGGMISGRVLSDEGLWETFLRDIGFHWQVNPSNFMHLWFLYVLLAVYALTLVSLWVIRRGIDRRGDMRRLADKAFRRVLGSSWGVVWLAVPSAILLFLHPGWWGIEAFPTWFTIPWTGLLGYWLFFAAGWMLYAHADLLRELARSWQRNLALGVSVSVIVFSISIFSDDHATPTYPLLEGNHFIDLSPLVAAGTTDETDAAGSLQTRVWQRLSPQHQRLLVANRELTPDQLAGLALEFNRRVIFDPTFSDQAASGSHEAQQLVLGEAPEARHGDMVGSPLHNRQLLESIFPTMIRTNFMQQPGAQWLKLGYSAGYGLVMWLLVLGFVGMFHSWCDRPSPLSRYLADSAYWVYIIHLPVLFQIELWIADQSWGWGGIPKFLVYNVVATIVCFASYHYLVRSTFIGRALNGRTYPFVPWFGARPASQVTDRYRESTAAQRVEPAAPSVPEPHVVTHGVGARPARQLSRVSDRR